MRWINGIDEISRKREVVLRGWMSSFLWFKYGVKNAHLEFFLENEKIGETTTDLLGRFYFPYVFPKPGIYAVTVKDYFLEETITVFIPEENEKRKIIVCDVDNTLIEFSMLSFLMGSQLKAIQGARETLKILSEKHIIVYLTHREARFSNVTKKWFKAHDFPLGPVFLWSYKEDSFSNKKYKQKALERIREKSGMEFLAGIGDKKTDLEAYYAAGIPNVFNFKKSEDWKIIREVLYAK